VTELSTRTFGNEEQLPRVPLPTLEHTCERFLQWCTPLLDEEQLTETKAAVAEFLAPDSPAHTLHAALTEYDQRPDVHSWLDTFWPYRYLGRRDRIALNANFFFLFEATGESQLDRAAGLVAAALRQKGLIDREELPPVLQRGQPLSMEQNRYLFSSTRIPGVERDTVRTPYSREWPGPSTERHIVVFRQGRMFRLDVLGPDGVPHTLSEITEGLRPVLDARPAADGHSVGHLTSKARAEWAASREALRSADPANAANLEVLETALFCLVLDEHEPTSTLDAANQLLHGNSANRWFDKGISLIVFADGTAGFNGEHCKLDGTTVIAFLDSLLDTPAAEQSEASGAREQGVPEPAELEFVLDDALRADVTEAGRAFAEYAAATATTTVRVPEFSAERAKALRCSPDAFAQLSFQLAHRRAKGITGATYESIATRSFLGGRTEAMRVVTPEVVAFADVMQDTSAGDGERRAAFRAAADAHVQRAKQCQAGDAPEQHLWELQLIGVRRGAELGVTEPLALYSSPGWLVMRDDYLSTSAVPSPHVQFWGFGSTSQKCIGVGYALLPDRFDIYLSTPRTVGEQMHQFAEELIEAVSELDTLLSAEPGGPADR
jgi:carnitine O-acetyltransferase